MASRHLSRGQIVAIAVSSAAAFVAIVAWIFSIIVSDAAGNPLAGKPLYVYPESSAAIAARTATGDDAVAFDRIAQTPTGIWLTPERHDATAVAGFVNGIVSAAGATASVPVFVVYGIPNRDCSNQSAGGTPVAEYPAWVGRIAAGIGDHPSIVVLEPDSLALTEQCGGLQERVDLLERSIDAFTSENTLVYLDGGHSTWLPPEKQAELLTAAGVSRVRGFASNVSNFNATDAEVAYSERVSSLTGGAHYVIDVGRNGNGGSVDWCNPPGRALGDPPQILDDEGAHDADLWIKNPGESDGACNGGPAAGQWWPEYARGLAGF